MWMWLYGLFFVGSFQIFMLILYAHQHDSWSDFAQDLSFSILFSMLMWP